MKPTLFLAIGLSLLAASISAPAQTTQQLHGHVPPAVARLQPRGLMSRSEHLRLAIGLPLREQGALSNLFAAIYDPASPQFHHYLTPEQFTAQFGPSENDYRALQDFVTSHGLTVTATYPNRVALEVDGAVADIEKLLHVTMQVYDHPTEVRTFYAPDREPSADLAVPIQFIGGLDNFHVTRPLVRPMKSAASKSGGAVPNDGSAADGSYIGSDFRNAYLPGVTNLTGAGQIVGLMQYEGFFYSDITNYAKAAGIPVPPIVIVPVNGGITNIISGQTSEASLDIEMVMSMAPSATIYVYEDTLSLPPDWVAILSAMVTNTACKQFSCSYAYGPKNPTAENLFIQLAMQGQSFFTASGDDDSYFTAHDVNFVGFPSDSPHVTSVGGTTLTTAANGSYSSETVWNWDTPQSGGNSGSSGGYGTDTPMPNYQAGISNAANLASTTYRNVPDVALTADNVEVWFDNGTNDPFGGTSCAAPLWAGFMANVSQQAVALGKPTAGFINPAVYSLGLSTNYAACFKDITTGNNEWANNPTDFSAVTGYDLATGWGTPNGTNLLNALVNPPPPEFLFVANTNDSGDGSLRQMVSLFYPGTTIRFAPNLSGQTIYLTSELRLTNNITIDASALPGGIQISGGGSNRVFEVDGATVTFNALNIVNGAAGSGYGGGILNDGTVILSQCTLSGNSSSQGGAMENLGTCFMTNCTLTGNISAGNGGAVDNNNGSLSLTHCTVVGNSAGGGAGGVANYLSTLTLLNSIVAGNSGAGAGDIYNFPQSSVVHSGSNIVQTAYYDPAGSNIGNADITSPPMLAPLGNYGGPTLTMMPLAGSPAIDSAVATAVTVDQRGVPRPVGPGPDIGAVEFESAIVTTPIDNNMPGSLRYANTYTPSGGTITFDPSLAFQAVVLTNGPITLAHNLTIDGSAFANGAAISGNSNSQIFMVNGGVTVVLKSLTLSNAFVSGGLGGAIESFGNLTLEDCRLVNNRCLGGTAGAVGAVVGQLTMINTTLSSNVCDNVSGVYIQNETATLVGCTFSGNSGVTGDALRVNTSQLTAVNTTFSGNSVNASAASAITIQSSSGQSSSVALTNCTIAGNTVTSAGQPGAIYLQSGGGANFLYLANTIVSGNLSGGAPGDITGSADPSSSFSLIGAGGGLVNGVNGNQVGVNNPQLEPLGNYGGQTQTMPELAGSPAIDAGSDAAAAGIATDQRGQARVAGPSVDIGAAEFQANPVVITNDSGPGTLRYAVNYCPVGTTITFAANLSGQTILLTSGPLTVNDNLTVDASALPNGIEVNGNSNSEIFLINDGTVVLNSLTLRNGFGGSDGFGGAIESFGNLTLEDCRLVNNQCPDGTGGAAASVAGQLTMINTTVSSNVCDNVSGVYIADETATLVGCTFSGNSGVTGDALCFA
ncbi:MAG TPA: S53 family peptidase, partial [Verrucomicrobiae bacterium]|nr:S53 family peptidase [Verrucomicrobiae bacterium]